MTYETKNGDILDDIVHNFYGKTSGYVEMVLSFNRHLAFCGEFLPAGIKIELPVISVQKREISATEISLWK